MMPLGIVFGAAHAMTPGHSKSILASYVLSSGLSPWRAVESPEAPFGASVSSH
jgi:ABC-type nickel/cobalt efflux system permease component RcnA